MSFKYIKVISFILSLSILFLATINDNDDFTNEDKIRINEAYRIFNHCSNGIWSDWDKANFAILLVTNENEYLINHDNPTDDFKLIYFDTLLNSKVYTRQRTFNNNLLATFPAVNGVSTIVIGTPENTGRSVQDWIITLLHEHFHQLQYSQKDYIQNVDSLNLSGGDKSGMWMLNYNFPYEDKNISEQYKLLVQSARKVVENLKSTDLDLFLRQYLSEREKFKSLLRSDDYKYFSFQIWQEGIARYTEIKIAECLKNGFEFSDAIKSSNNFKDSDSLYEIVLEKQLRRVDSQELGSNKRDCFYTLGALEGIILDNVNPDWRNLYFENPFYVENYFKQ